VWFSEVQNCTAQFRGQFVADADGDVRFATLPSAAVALPAGAGIAGVQELDPAATGLLRFVLEK
jgi:hypothetical protein